MSIVQASGEVYGTPDHEVFRATVRRFVEEELRPRAREFDAMYGSTPQKFGYVAADFDRLKGAKLVRLKGDHDVFGDGNVLIKSAPGHTPGHQVLVVRLPTS